MKSNEEIFCLAGRNTRPPAKLIAIVGKCPKCGLGFRSLIYRIFKCIGCDELVQIALAQ